MPDPLDPAAVVADFIDRVAPYDPAPSAPAVAMVAVRTATGTATFSVGDHVIRALCRALAVYRDPDDRGTCAQCGGRRLDENLHCRDCGRLHGILGEVIASQARRVADTGGSARPSVTGCPTNDRVSDDPGCPRHAGVVRPPRVVHHQRVTPEGAPTSTATPDRTPPR